MLVQVSFQNSVESCCGLGSSLLAIYDQFKNGVSERHECRDVVMSCRQFVLFAERKTCISLFLYIHSARNNLPIMRVNANMRVSFHESID